VTTDRFFDHCASIASVEVAKISPKGNVSMTCLFPDWNWAQWSDLGSRSKTYSEHCFSTRCVAGGGGGC